MSSKTTEFTDSSEKWETEGDEEEEEEEEDANKYKIPTDTGWAWVILAASCFEMMIVIGILKSSGILFIQLQARLQSTSAMTSLISTIQNAMYSLSSLLVMNLGLRSFTCRTSLFIGSFISCVAYAITSRATSVGLAMFSHGVLQGIGLSFMNPCIFVTVSKYFIKRRGLANSIAVSGGSIGGLVFAPLLTTLFEYYGYSGAFLITSGFFLNVCIVGALYRPPEFYTNRGKQRTKLKIPLPTKAPIVKLAGKLTERPGANESFKLSTTGSNKDISLDIYADKKLENHRNCEQREAFLNIVNGNHITRRPRTFTNSSVHSVVDDVLDKVSHSKAALYASSEMIAGSLLAINMVTENSDNDDEEEDDQSKNRNCLCRGLKNFASLFDFKLFKNPVFVIYLVAAGQMCAASALLGVYLAPHAVERGLDTKQTALLLTIIAAVDFVGRILFGYLADRNFMRTSSFVGIAGIILGIVSNFLHFFDGFGLLVFYSVCVGLFGGVHFALFAVILVEYFTLDKLQSCIGFVTLVHGTAVGGSFAIIGALRDSTGSYIVPFHFMGCQMICAGVLMMFLPIVDRCRQRAPTDFDHNHESVIS